MMSRSLTLTKTIALRQDVYYRLSKRGSYNETMNDIVENILDIIEILEKDNK